VYVILIIALALVIVVSAAWTPLFALIIAVPLFLLFLAYVGFSRRADEKVDVPERAGGRASREGDSPPADGGIWGERRA
jgi:Sec-independent protein secretion pathway component TatC